MNPRRTRALPANVPRPPLTSTPKWLRWFAATTVAPALPDGHPAHRQRDELSDLVSGFDVDVRCVETIAVTLREEMDDERCSLQLEVRIRSRATEDSSRGVWVFGWWDARASGEWSATPPWDDEDEDGAPVYSAPLREHPPRDPRCDCRPPPAPDRPHRGSCPVAEASQPLRVLAEEADRERARREAEDGPAGPDSFPGEDPPHAGAVRREALGLGFLPSDDESRRG